MMYCWFDAIFHLQKILFINLDFVLPTNKILPIGPHHQCKVIQNLFIGGTSIFCCVFNVPKILLIFFRAKCFWLQVVQKEREEKLAEILKNRLNQYVQGNKEDFVNHAEAEVSRLSNAGSISCFLKMIHKGERKLEFFLRSSWMNFYQ